MYCIGDVSAREISYNSSGSNKQQQHEQFSTVQTQKASSSCINGKNHSRNLENTTRSKEKPYKCDYCEYRCARRYVLQEHIKTHTKQKPYKCVYCHYTCAQRNQLQQHIRTHTKEKPYKCDYCEYTSAFGKQSTVTQQNT